MDAAACPSFLVKLDKIKNYLNEGECDGGPQADTEGGLAAVTELKIIQSGSVFT